MELTLSQAVDATGGGPRRLQQAVAAGDLPLHRVVGRTQTIEATALQAWLRARGRGRRWDDRTRAAAVRLLDGQPADDLSASSRSRLRGALRAIDAAGLAHRCGASRGWHRFHSATHGRAQVARAVLPTAASGLTEPLAGQLGLSPGDPGHLYGRAADLDAVESDFGLVLDDEGDITLADNTRTGASDTAVLLDLYLLGDARQSALAAAEIERRARSC
ncbi:MAG: hypothetical protein LBH76_07045 [Propionibacteriaceae bacterium]|jgi:hypothetical protein|nr:hypothetical protein [Propionibacteriaceae bacterium]